MALLAGCDSSTADAAPDGGGFGAATDESNEWLRSSPEAQGLDSARLATLVTTLGKPETGVHRLVVVRHDRLVLDASFFPYDVTRPHDVASCTKSLTSTAVGLALASRKLGSLDQSIASFFPDRTIAHDDARKQKMSVRDALTMTSGLACGEDALVAWQGAPTWLGFALDLPMASEPGTKWRYCSVVSHLLSGVVQRATGSTVEDVLRIGLFEPLGIRDFVWLEDPEGYSRGFGDARFYGPDLARFGLVMMHGGRWNGRSVLDPAWIDDATRNHVSTASGPAGGYGYQWWTSADGSFRANGRGGQRMYVVPSQDLVVVIQSGAVEARAAANAAALESQVAAALSDRALPENPAAVESLAQAVAAARKAPPASPIPTAPALAATLAGATYRLESNVFGWTSFGLAFSADEATLELGVGAETSTLHVGLDGVPRVTRSIVWGTDARYRDVDVALKGVWLDGATFEVTFDTIDRIDAGKLTFRWSGADATLTLFEDTFLHEALVIPAKR